MPVEKYEDLIKQIEKIQDESDLKDYHAFVYWFIETSFEQFERENILNSICDGTHDKGVDAVILDPIEKKVKIIQSKFERAGNKTQFSENDIKLFGGVRDYFQNRRAFNAAMRSANPVALRLMNSAFDGICKKQYSLQLIFITTHKNIPGVEDLINEVMGFKTNEFSVYDYSRVMYLLNEKMRGFTPSLGHYHLPYKDEDKIIVRTFPFKSWVFTVPIEALCNMANKYHDNLFRKNVRDFLGLSVCNKGIRQTLKENPSNFWYYNNGISILCDEANMNVENKYIRLVNPQVINGCQTVRSIEKFRGELQGDVLVRVIEAKSHEFMNALTLYQNSSNPVDKRDLKSNDPIQVRLKTEFKIQGYYYEIKRGQEYDKMRKKYPAMKCQYTRDIIIKNAQVAKALAAIKLSPGIAVSKGNEDFFGNSYDKLFVSNISTHSCLAPLILFWWIKESYKGAKRKFYKFDKPFKFKNPASYYVLKLIHEPLNNQSDWERKVISFYENSDWEESTSFSNKLNKIVSQYFKVIYEAWRSFEEPNHNSYLKKTTTVEEIRKKYKKEIGQLNKQTLNIFRKFILKQRSQ